MKPVDRTMLKQGQYYVVNLTVFRFEAGGAIRIVCHHGDIPLESYEIMLEKKAYLLSQEEVQDHVGHNGMIFTSEELENYIPALNTPRDAYSEAFIAIIVVGAYVCMLLFI